MKMDKPDFTKFSYEELRQAERSLKRKMNPQYYKEVTELLLKYPNAEEKPEPKKKPCGWLFYAISTPLFYLLLGDSLISGSIRGRRGWIYENDQPVLYWFVICIYFVMCAIVTDRLYVAWYTRKK